MAPVRFAIARCARSGSRPASHAITASTANSGSVWSHARMASASPWEMRNCAASAPQATRNADSRMLGKVQMAERAEPPACNADASSFRNRTGVQSYHGTRQNEVGEPTQLPRVAHGADGDSHSVPDARARNARAAGRRSDAGRVAPDAGARRGLAEVAHARLRDEGRRSHRRRAVRGEAREHDLRARHRDLLDVRAPHAAVLRAGPRGVSAERAHRRAVQDPAGRRSVRAAPPGPGAAHRPGGRGAVLRAETVGRRRGRRGVSPLHDDARRRETELQDGHELAARRVPGRRQDARRVSQAGTRRHFRAVKIALVTGASRGIGLAVAIALRARGMHVVRLARSLKDARAERRTDIQCDVTKPADVERALDQVDKELAVPDVLVNNAGIFFIKPLGETTLEDFTATLAANLTAPFLFARRIIPKMVERGSGHLVTIGSISDYIGFSGSTAYAASKFGLRGMHEVIRQETAKSGVRTTLISPGPVDTDIWNPVDPDSKPGFTKRKDMMKSEDVAAAVVYAVTQPEHLAVTEIRLLPAVYTPRG